MTIDYSHAANLHTFEGPKAALPVFFASGKPRSLLDVGCGTGRWLKAAADFGIQEVFGVEGVEIPPDKLDVPAEKVQQQDLTVPWNLDKKFEVVLCLEVAEHLESQSAGVLIDALVKHSDRIYFSAACPGQMGQHHVNCQWPAYWQDLLNARGYACTDDVRWQIWNDVRIEPWYRQNVFVARRAPKLAGRETRIKAVIHPGIWDTAANMMPQQSFREHVQQIEQGRMPLGWHLTLPARALRAKLKRKVK